MDFGLDNRAIEVLYISQGFVFSRRSRTAAGPTELSLRRVKAVES
jgi:hypothetical protein